MPGVRGSSWRLLEPGSCDALAGSLVPPVGEGIVAATGVLWFPPFRRQRLTWALQKQMHALRKLAMSARSDSDS
jgi:hypothetical protein